MWEWIFRIFGKERSDVDDWIGELSPSVMARMDSIINHMRVTRVWSRPYFRPLKRHQGISEIRFIVQNIQYRPLGCFGPGNKEYTILFGAKEQGDEFNPLNAPLIVEKRRKDIFERKEGTHEYNQ